MKTALIVLAGAASLSACAAGDTPRATVDGIADRQACFTPATLRNFRTDGDVTVYVRAPREGVFEVSTAGLCRGVADAGGLVITSSYGGGRVCVGDDVEILLAGPVPGPASSARCRARVVRHLTDDQVAALPSRSWP